MFDQNLEMKIRGVNAQVKDNNGEIERVSYLSLQCELTSEVASGISKVASGLQKELANGGLKSAVLPMDGVSIVASFNDGDVDHKVEGKGVKASLRRANKEDANPTVKFIMSFPTSHDDLLFFIDHLEQSLTVQMSREQLQIPGV